MRLLGREGGQRARCTRVELERVAFKWAGARRAARVGLGGGRGFSWRANWGRLTYGKRQCWARSCENM